MHMARRMVLLAWALLVVMLCAAAEGAGERRVYAVQAAGVAALVDEAGESILEDDGIDEIFAVRPGSLYAAGTRGGYVLYDADGNALNASRFAMIDDAGDALIFRQDGLCGAMNGAGEIIVPAEWERLVSNGEGGFLALAEGVVWRIDAHASATPLESVKASDFTGFSDGRMVFIGENGCFGCLDAAGNVTIDDKFDWIDSFRDGSAIAAEGALYGLIDPSGNWIVEPRYRWMGRGKSFIAALTEDGSLQVFSAEGSLLYEVHASAAQAAVTGDYVALWDAGAARLYNAKGRCIYEALPETLFFPGTDGQVIASQGRWDAPGQWLVNPSGIAGEGRYQRIVPLLSGRYAFLTMQGVDYYSEILGSLQISWNYDTARWGLMDGEGAALLPADYLEIRATGEDHLLLLTEDAVSFADRDGNILRNWSVSATRTSSGAAG